MKIVIAARAPWDALAKLLGQENHDITLMDEERERLSSITETAEVFTVIGAARHPLTSRRREPAAPISLSVSPRKSPGT